MHDIIADIEGVEVVYGELFGLFHAAADADAMEAVEDFMVRVVADHVLTVYESVMDVLSLDEFRNQAAVLREDGVDAVQLVGLVAEYHHFISTLHLLPYVFREYLEVLVEHRLRGDIELNRVFILAFKRGVDEYTGEAGGLGEELLVFVHVGGVEPQQGICRQYIEDAVAVGCPFGYGGGYDVRIVALFFGQLGVAVEQVDLFYFVAPEGYPERMVAGE